MSTSDHPAGGAPRATYRLQLHAGFTFTDAERVVAYLDDLGISDAYASPVLTLARRQHPRLRHHRPQRAQPRAGRRGRLRRAQRRAARTGMGLILDVVPNHMGIGDPRNTLVAGRAGERRQLALRPLLRHRLAARAKRELRDKVLLPILGDQYGKVLERGELQLGLRATGAFFLQLLRPPLARSRPRSYARPAEPPPGRSWIGALGADHEHVHGAPEHPHRPRATCRRAARPTAERIAERNREKEVIKRRLAALCRGQPGRCAAAIDATLADVSTARPGDPRSFDLLRRAAGAAGLPAGLLARRRARRSTTGASSTSTTWPPSAWSCPRSSTPPTG